MPQERLSFELLRAEPWAELNGLRQDRGNTGLPGAGGLALLRGDRVVASCSLLVTWFSAKMLARGTQYVEAGSYIRNEMR